MMNKEGKFIEICILHLQIIFIQLILAFLQAPFKAPLLLPALLVPTLLLALLLTRAGGGGGGAAAGRLVPEGGHRVNVLHEHPRHVRLSRHAGGSTRGWEDDRGVGVVVNPVPVIGDIVAHDGAVTLE